MSARRTDLDGFAEELDSVGRVARARVGAEDLAHVERMARTATTLGVAGRVLCALSIEPLSFTLGVTAIAASKLINIGEMGHTIFHGVYDEIDPSGRFHSEKYSWEWTVDEAAWRNAHNQHHRYTNVVGRDGDANFGFLRLVDGTVHRALSWFQLPAFALLLPMTGFFGQFHFTGVYDLVFGNGFPNRFDYLRDSSPRTVAKTMLRAVRKPVTHFVKNYLLWPALAGPLAPKVALGTFLAARIQNTWIGSVIFCSHVGDDVATYSYETRARSKGEFYAMQVEATTNLELPRTISMLSGGLDRQIEHHLFPDLPADRCREIAPDVKRICKKYGVQYRCESLTSRIAATFRTVARLSFPSSSNTARRRPARAAAPVSAGTASPELHPTPA